MKYIFAIMLLVSINSNAGVCIFDDDEIGNLNQNKFEVQYHIKVPIPAKMVDVLNKFFGNFSEKDCRNAFTATKIINRSTQEHYMAFYTHQDSCDGGNSYGVILRGQENNPYKPYALIEDSYIDCYVLD